MRRRAPGRSVGGNSEALDVRSRRISARAEEAVDGASLAGGAIGAGVGDEVGVWGAWGVGVGVAADGVTAGPTDAGEGDSMLAVIGVERTTSRAGRGWWWWWRLCRG